MFDAIHAHRNVVSSYALKGLQAVHENIVVLVHDGSTHSSDIDNAKMDLLFRGGSAAVFDYQQKQ